MYFTHNDKKESRENGLKLVIAFFNLGNSEVAGGNNVDNTALCEEGLI